MKRNKWYVLFDKPNDKGGRTVKTTYVNGFSEGEARIVFFG